MRKDQNAQVSDTSGDATKNKSLGQNFSSAYFHHSN